MSCCIFRLCDATLTARHHFYCNRQPVACLKVASTCCPSCSPHPTLLNSMPCSNSSTQEGISRSSKYIHKNGAFYVLSKQNRDLWSFTAKYVLHTMESCGLVVKVTRQMLRILFPTRSFLHNLGAVSHFTSLLGRVGNCLCIVHC